jgi:outer membrane biogenesis lipoprotein LolB
MKKFLALLIVSSSFLLISCGKSSPVQPTTSPTTQDQQNRDFGLYTGKEYSINQTKDLYDFQVTLNKIIIGNQNF